MKSILGIGTDLAKNSRFESILQKSIKGRFLFRVLHPSELLELNTKSDLKTQSRYLASRWAYKEALVKASGRKDLQYSAIFLTKDKNGKPNVQLESGNKVIFEKELGVKSIHVSISHEEEYSMAFVILEK